MRTSMPCDAKTGLHRALDNQMFEEWLVTTCISDARFRVHIDSDSNSNSRKDQKPDSACFSMAAVTEAG